MGVTPPGTKFTYDSNVYISHLSYLLHHVTGEPPVEWATREYAIPLGLPDFFAYDNFGEEISAGGGQLMSCRDALRVCMIVLLLHHRWFSSAIHVVSPGVLIR